MNKIKACAFDLDGTIYYENQLIDGVIEILNFLKEHNIEIFYFTNNSRETREEIYKKLLSMGLDLQLQKVYSATYGTAVYLKENKINNVYSMGAHGLTKELKLHGINVRTEDVEAIIIGLHHDFNYLKLTEAVNIIMENNCKIIACNRDRTYPGKDNKIMAGCGSIVAAVEEACGKKVDFVTGKPNNYMLKLLSKDWALSNNQILVVGDSYETDIKMAMKYGCHSVLISKEKDYKNTMVIDNILQLKKLFGDYYETDKYCHSML